MAFLIKLSLWALAFVPLIASTSAFFPYIFGKVMMIRIFISLTSLLFAVHLVANSEFRRETYGKLKQLVKNPLFVTTSAFITLFAISTIFAANPFRAFFGDVERGEGLVGFLYFYGFFVYSLLLFEKKDWVVFFKSTLITGIILLFGALMQLHGAYIPEQGVRGQVNYEVAIEDTSTKYLCTNGNIFAYPLYVLKGIIVAPDGQNPQSRPGSCTGNPAFLGGYFLFVIFAALASFYYSKKEPIWRVFAAIMVPVGAAGVLLTQTRSAMVGLVVGLLSLVVYGAFHGKSISVRKGVSLRNASLGLLAAMLLVGGIFFSTKNAPIWQKVPGFNRVAQFTLKDATVQTRLISLGVSKNAIDPEKNGMQRFLIGWGPENFSIAYNKYYNPEYYRYEHTWFDRAHNKLMDVAVMNGILGLFAYLGIWLSVGWLVFRRKGFSFDMMAALFFGTAFFFNLLFVFDQISTIIPLFAFFAFLTFVSTLESETHDEAKGKKLHMEELAVKDYAVYGVFGGASLFFLWALIFWTIVPFSQMSTYLSAIGSSKNAAAILQYPDAIFEPYTFAQQDIRGHFLNIMIQYYGKSEQLQPLIDESIKRMEELVEKEPTNPRYLLMLANAYDRRARAGGGVELFKKAEIYYKRAAELAPLRQDVVYETAFNLAAQGRNDEATALLRNVLKVDDVSPETHYFLGAILAEQNRDYHEALKEIEIAMGNPAFANFKSEEVRNIYRIFLKRTYTAHDKVNFMIVTKRLEVLDPDQADTVRQMEAWVNKGQWPAINFN